MGNEADKQVTKPLSYTFVHTENKEFRDSHNIIPPMYCILVLHSVNLHWWPSFLTVPVLRSSMRPWLAGSCVLNCSLTFSTSSGWTCSYTLEPNHSLCQHQEIWSVLYWMITASMKISIKYPVHTKEKLLFTDVEVGRRPNMLLTSSAIHYVHCSQCQGIYRKSTLFWYVLIKHKPSNIRHSFIISELQTIFWYHLDCNCSSKIVHDLIYCIRKLQVPLFQKAFFTWGWLSTGVTESEA